METLSKDDISLLIKSLFERLDEKYNIWTVLATFILTCFLLFLAVTKEYENSVRLLFIFLILVLNGVIILLQLSMKRSIESISEDKPLFICFIFMALALTVMCSATLLGDFNFSPNQFQETITTAISLIGAVEVKNDLERFHDNILLYRRYL